MEHQYCLVNSWPPCFSWSLACASTSAVGTVTEITEPGGKPHRVSLPCFQTWGEPINQNGSGVIPERVAVPTLLPIIEFSKIATQKQGEKRMVKDTKLVLGWQRTVFIF